MYPGTHPGSFPDPNQPFAPPHPPPQPHPQQQQQQWYPHDPGYQQPGYYHDGNSHQPPAHGYYPPPQSWPVPNHAPGPHYHQPHPPTGWIPPTHPDPYQASSPVSPYQSQPPPYSLQHTPSWPTSPQYGYPPANTGPPAPSHPPHAATQPPVQVAYTPPVPTHRPQHAHHGPMSLAIVPGIGLPGFPSNALPQPTSLSMDDAQRIRDAFGVGGLHHPPVINIIANRSPSHLESLLVSYRNLTGHDLITTLKETGNNIVDNIAHTGNKYFNTAAIAILLGPIKSEAFWVYRAVKGTGTDEDLLTEAIFGRNNHELDIMKAYVRSNYQKTFEEYVRADLSMGTKTLFELGMEPDHSKNPMVQMPVDLTAAARDMRKIINSTSNYNLFSRNGTAVYEIFAQRSKAQLLAIVQQYRQETGKNLRDLINKSFFGHAKDVLLYILDGAVNMVDRDAKLLEDAMVGVGTKHHLLISRLIRIHWDKQHLAEVKARYSSLYPQDLSQRIRKEIKGSYRDLMLAIADSDVSPWRQ